MAERVTAELKVISVKVWYEIKRKNDCRGIFFDRGFSNSIQGHTSCLVSLRQSGEEERKGDTSELFYSDGCYLNDKIIRSHAVTGTR